MDPDAESSHLSEVARRAGAEELLEWAPDAVVVAEGMAPATGRAPASRRMRARHPRRGGTPGGDRSRAAYDGTTVRAGA
jgi:hypothetical protein